MQRMPHKSAHALTIKGLHRYEKKFFRRARRVWAFLLRPGHINQDSTKEAWRATQYIAVAIRICGFGERNACRSSNQFPYPAKLLAVRWDVYLHPNKWAFLSVARCSTDHNTR
jgi:hypothetical protein